MSRRGTNYRRDTQAVLDRWAERTRRRVAEEERAAREAASASTWGQPSQGSAPTAWDRAVNAADGEFRQEHGRAPCPCNNCAECHALYTRAEALLEQWGAEADDDWGER